MMNKSTLKIVSALCGILIWLYVVSSAEIELSQNLEVKIDLPEGYSISSEFPHEVIYKVKGPGLFVRKFFSDNSVLRISQEDFYKEGKLKYNISLDKLKDKIPFGLKIIDVLPGNFNLYLEKSSEKLIKVKPVLSDSFLTRYQIKSISTYPSEVKIIGPRSLISRVTEVYTEELEFLEEYSLDNIKVKLAQLDSRLTLVDKSVVLKIELTDRVKEVTYKNIPITFQSVGFIKNASTKSVSITVEGDIEKIENLNRNMLVISAQTSASIKGIQSIELIPQLPQGIRVVKLEPSIIQVNVEQ